MWLTKSKYDDILRRLEAVEKQMRIPAYMLNNDVDVTSYSVREILFMLCAKLKIRVETARIVGAQFVDIHDEQQTVE